MKNKKIAKIVFGVLVVVICAFIITLLCNDRIDTYRNVEVSISNKIVKIDNEKFGNVYSNVYKNTYEYYEKNDLYEYYMCLVKIENNSNSTVANVKFESRKGNNYILDYENNIFAPFNISSNSVGYVPCVISVKKEITEEELKKIPDNLPLLIKLSFVESSNAIDYDFSILKTYDVCNEDYSKNDIQFHVNL